MKTITKTVLSILLLLSFNGNAQNVKPQTPVKDLTLNFSVPDIPAFNALQTQPSNLLRPSNAKDFAIISDQFYDGSNIIIPKSIAIEFSPITIFKKNDLTLQDYQKHPAWYDFRMSIGSMRDSLKNSHLSIGFRTTLKNKGDIKRDEHLLKLANFLEDKTVAQSAFYTEKLKQLKLPREKLTDELFKKNLDKEFDEVWYSKNDSLNKVITGIIDSTSWNAEKLDVALAFVGSSPDSLAKNITFNSLMGWITYACPLTDKGQFMIGGNFNLYNKNEAFYFEMSIPARVYYGSNEFKLYVEGQYSYKGYDQTNNFMADLGCEYSIGKGFWLDFSAGFENDFTNNTSKLVSNFKIIYAIPGNLN